MGRGGVVFLIVVGLVAGAGALYAQLQRSAIGPGGSRLVGLWYGEEPQSGYANTAWLMRHNADHTFRLEWRAYDECGAAGAEVFDGTWEVDWPYYEVNRTYDEPPPFATPEIYLLIWVDEGRMVYWSNGAGLAYTSKRVPDDFQFPRCFAIPEAVPSAPPAETQTH